MTGSQHLFAEYRRNDSDTAFRELVNRYIDLVYSTALRLVEGDTHRAKDVSQTVFVNLARKARTLPEDLRLAGWLHRDACFMAATLMRGERRRQSRERQAVEMNALQNTEADFSEVAPILDEAINELGEEDRTAILLRFFEQHDFRTVGQILGNSEDAARMRVNRALEKLEIMLKRRGVTAGSVTLGVVLSANAVQAAPVGLALTISTACIAGTIATATATTATTMNWLNVKSIASIIAAALTAGTATHIVQQREADRLRAENKNLITQQKQIEIERDGALSAVSQKDAQSEQSLKEKNELLRLRGEIGSLRRQVAEIGKQEQNQKLRAAPESGNPSRQAGTQGAHSRERAVIYRDGKYYPKDSWSFAGYDTPEAALQSWTWAMSKGDKEMMLSSLTPDARKEFEKMMANKSNGELAEEGAKGSREISGYSVSIRERPSESEAVLTVGTVTADGRTNSMRMGTQRVGNEWKIIGPVEDNYGRTVISVPQ